MQLFFFNSLIIFTAPEFLKSGQFSLKVNPIIKTLVEALDFWGTEVTLKKLVGMFAFAFWDKKLRSLTLVRDRMGEKPLYFGWQGVGDKIVFLFGSELKALCAYPRWLGDIDRDAVASYMRCGYVPSPYTIYRDVRKLIPGTYLTLTPESSAGAWPNICAYWSARDVAAKEVLRDLSDQEAVGRLETLLSESVRQQMISDVPLGAFLSGGIDSSTIVALMQKLNR